MSFDKFNQLEAAIDAYGQRMARDGKDSPHTKIAHLMCMELVRDLKAERDAAANYPGMVVRIDYKGRQIAISLSQEAIDNVHALQPVALIADRVRGAIAEVLKP